MARPRSVWPALVPVLVEGPSMLPTLSAGDCLLMLRGARVRPGDLVVARFDRRPGLLVVKRAHHREGGQTGRERWHVRSDSRVLGTDSRTLGPASVVGRVVLRYWPLPPLPARWLARPSTGRRP